MKSIPCRFFIPFTTFAMAACAHIAADRTPENRSERQMLGLMEKFDRWDLNGDGRLDIDELNEAARITGIPAQDILKFYDTNKNDSISLREAQDAYQRRVDQRP